MMPSLAEHVKFDMVTNVQLIKYLHCLIWGSKV